ncbi:DUF551 domain-containing protein [Klebsiella pneumoniae]
MTKSTITKERLEEIVSDPMINQGSEFAMMARMALSAMDSEPVAEVVSIYGDPEDFGEREIRPLVGIQQMPYGTKLYRHAQPAPVSPEEMTPEQAYEIGDYHGDPVDVFARGANWMRQYIIDSTLAAGQQSPGSEPATVPGKWIPVSERMPEVGVKVLCFPVEGEPIHAVFNGQLWLQDISWSNSDEPIDNVITCNVTHWMPLPAAPQESKP